MATTSPFAKKAESRVVAIRKTVRPADMFGVEESSARGISIQQDHQGRLYLCRTSKDGWVQAYDILGAHGLHLKAGKQR